MADFKNPFRPGAGHTPPYLAGRQHERKEFIRLLSQEIILENLVLTGLRGVGKTVLLDTFKPRAIKNGWLWVGTDLSESATVSEDKIAIRLCTDLSILTSGIVVNTSVVQKMGFSSDVESTEYTLGYQTLLDIYRSTPGLALDKLKKVLETAWRVLSSVNHPKGIIFAYDEVQNLSDQAQKEEYPLALLLDAFQSLQRQGMPLMLVLTGLPTLFPKLVESRTFSERMFRVVFLKSLKPDESEEAIHKPIKEDSCPVKLSEHSVQTIIKMSGGYPYFIQFICREVYDAFMQKIDKGEQASVPTKAIEQKLDTDFFAGRWARATDRQRELLSIIASLENCNNEFSVQETVERSKAVLEKSFSSSHVHQMLGALSTQGLVFKNRHGKYSFAVPLMENFIARQGKHV
ncbi:MAG: ATP-binding protein [Methylococcales symbiont of Iophon sp. n. MRB-2018]|nr:MAG: ATP-binding protein [Methylococcales symbiont of Iophon sp. n. MRB-2018]KAF3979625.1 MAG: ATP-binding protein [Methylococcales symbiont of Iophon sp. n. MRB-2018]